ncbi:MAG: DUF192 domain-containing protein [Ignavibacteriaceae bacterium]|jgi:hypothetical protein
MSKKIIHKSKKSLQVQKPAKRKIYLIILAVILVIIIAVFFIFQEFINKGEKDPEYMFRKDGILTFYDSTNVIKTKSEIQIADNEFEEELGLMYRKQMDENKGMLFVFPKPIIQTFWMRNTFIPLDMIFVNPDKIIVTIQKNTKILSDSTYSSTAPAQYVIEVDAGFCDRHNIKVGDKVSWIRTQSNPD